MACRRVDGGKLNLPCAGLGKALAAELDSIHAVMLQRATDARDAKLVQTT